MSGTFLGTHMDPTINIELLPECSLEAAAFLQDIDCFYYRVSHTWYERFGRVIFEAMACGLPVVCKNRGGTAYTSSMESMAIYAILKMKLTLLSTVSDMTMP